MGKEDHEVILLKISNIEQTVNKIEKRLEQEYVTKEQYERLNDKVLLLQRVVFGFVSIVLVGVVGAFMSLVLK